MPKRREIFASGEVYHIYNRGVEKRVIFEHTREYQHFLELLQFYQRLHHLRFSKLTSQERVKIITDEKGEPLVEILCYCLMPNHFHLVLKQIVDLGVPRFVQLIGNGYSHYFNKLHERVGPLFQGKFKAVRIQDNKQLLHVSRYLHLNPVVSSLVERPDEYPWSSFQEYITGQKGFCSKDLILGQFKTIASYQKFVEDYADYAKKLHRFEHLMLEKPERNKV